jgi:hypothetical protein
VDNRISLPGRAASWTSGTSGGAAASGESVRIVEPPADVRQASFTSAAVTGVPRSAPVEAGPLVDITSLPDAKKK